MSAERAQKIGALALVPFVAMLVVHGFNHEMPLFLASFAGFAAALLGNRPHPEDARAGAARSPAGVRRVLLSVSAVSVDHAADQRGLLRPDAGAGPSGIETLGRRMSRSRNSSAARFSRRFSTTTSSPTSRRAACTIWNLRPCISSRWRRSPATRWAAAGRTSAARNRSWRTPSSSATWTHTTRPVQWIKEMTPVIVEMLGVSAVICFTRESVYPEVAARDTSFPGSCRGVDAVYNSPNLG